MNDLSFVRRVLTLLREHGLLARVFGGWAEEVLGVTSRRAHADLDLLYPDEDFDALDRLIRLVRRDEQGLYTPFWGTRRHDWPAGTLASASDLLVASAAALLGYRRAHSALRAA